ncbi:hypothetical protein [Lebetimonas sp. JH292]|uniref:hypothetical protein n=1 Tax=Lebetimonas sp. JH292 TaxID=990068 RepID=UPI0004BC6C51|nr:hypothetical protein [Lebetimonas sp. JH292]
MRFDSKIRTFDIIMRTANGSSYNSYVIRGDEGVCVSQKRIFIAVFHAFRRGLRL